MGSYGNKNNTLRFGILRINSAEFSGFAAIAKSVLGGIAIMDKKGLLPYIDIKSNCYTERHKIHGSFNAYEYYFEQPCDVILGRHISKQEILQSANVEFVADVTENYIIVGEKGYYSCFDEQEMMEKDAAILRKYIRLNKHTAPIYDEVKEKLGGGNIVGIHVRRTGFKEHTPGHPIAVEPTEHLNQFQEIQNGRKAFLATDEEEIVEMFLNSKIGKDVMYYEDVLRTPKKLADENIAVYCCEVNRENHKYRLGYEILKEILTLSCCDSLIAGYSSVSYLATIIKMSRAEKYKEYHILDNGVWPLEADSNWDHYWEYNKRKLRMINRENVASAER